MENFGIQSNLYQANMSSDDNIAALLADYLNNNRQEAARLLKVNGVDVGAFSSGSALRVAFLKGIKDSDTFRSQVSDALTSFIGKKNVQSNFVNNNQYLNAIAAPTSINPNYAQAVTPATTTKTESGGSFWSSLGKIFTPDVIQTGVKTGLNALSTKLQQNANNSTEQNALALEQLRLQQIQAQAEANKTQKKGLSTGAWVAIGVSGAALIGTIIWLAVRKK